MAHIGNDSKLFLESKYKSIVYNVYDKTQIISKYKFILCIKNASIWGSWSPCKQLSFIVHIECFVKGP